MTQNTDRTFYKPRGDCFEIDTDIGLPEDHVSQKKLLNTFARMEVDDSFFIPDLGTVKHYNHIFGNIIFFEKRYKKDFNGTVRFECDDDGVMGLRVWRGPDQERKDRK